MIGWLRRLWPFGRRGAVPVRQATVLNLPASHPVTAPPVIPPTGQTLVFRGHRWTQDGPPDADGIVRFVRALSVNGRAVASELKAHRNDLERQPDGSVLLRGRV